MDIQATSEGLASEKAHQAYHHEKTLEDKTNMSETKNYFDTSGGGHNSAWGPAAGAFLGALFGENGFGVGNNRQPSVTPDQLGTAINGLQGSLQRDQLQESVGDVSSQIAGLGGKISHSIHHATDDINCSISGVKDAIAAGNSANALAMCNLGHNISQGFSTVNQNIIAQGAQARELALQQALDAERARATELRIAQTELKNQAGHQATQVLLQQVVNSGNP